MHAEPALTESTKLDLPPDLLKALNSPAHRPKTDYRIEALKPSLFGRIVEKLIGPKS